MRRRRQAETRNGIAQRLFDAVDDAGNPLLGNFRGVPQPVNRLGLNERDLFELGDAAVQRGNQMLRALLDDPLAHLAETLYQFGFQLFHLLADALVDQRRKIVFADLPGYGYAKISKSISAGWPAFIEPYLAMRSTLKLCICLVDSNVPPQESDRQLIDWLRADRRAFAVVATKIDRLSGNERTRNLLALKKGLELHDVLPISAKTGYGISALWSRIEASSNAEG